MSGMQAEHKTNSTTPSPAVLRAAEAIAHECGFLFGQHETERDKFAAIIDREMGKDMITVSMAKQIERSWFSPMPGCKHPQWAGKTEDGGKAGWCEICRETAELRAQRDALVKALEEIECGDGQCRCGYGGCDMRCKEVARAALAGCREALPAPEEAARGSV